MAEALWSPRGGDGKAAAREAIGRQELCVQRRWEGRDEGGGRPAGTERAAEAGGNDGVAEERHAERRDDRGDGGRREKWVGPCVGPMIGKGILVAIFGQ
uniref:DUF834 domain-containing protein n=1 Tax=Oryza rufipogon TaxID=4529 RepID=A0A0E0QLN6_ORYRU